MHPVFRHRHIKRVKFCVAPPPPSKNHEYGCCQVSRDERHTRDEIFTAQIQDLFATLKSMEDTAGERHLGSFDLAIYSAKHPESFRLHNDQSARRTCLLEPEKLPDIKSVRSLKFNDNIAGIKYDYRILIDLIVRLPNAEHLECHVGMDDWTPHFEKEPATGYTREFDGPRRDTKHGFGNALPSLSHTEHLKSIRLDFFCWNVMRYADSIHHRKSFPNLVTPALKDSFSTSSESIRSFEGGIDHQFCICPNEGVPVPFLASFAKAAINMPALKHAALYSLLSWVVDCDDDYYYNFDYYEPPKKFIDHFMAWGFEYSVPGTMSVFMTDRNTVNRTGRQIRWNVGVASRYRNPQPLSEDWIPTTWTSAGRTVDRRQVW